MDSTTAWAQASATRQESWRTRLRCSSGVPLAAVRHAELEQRRMSSKAGRASAPTSSPVCVMCTASVDETVTHAVCDCAMYAARRAAAWAEIEAV